MSNRLVTRSFLAIVTALAIGSLAAPPMAEATEVEPHYYLAGNQFKTWFRSLVEPPKGWVENEEWTERYERVVLFENGDMSPAKPIMYVRAHPAADQPLDEYIRVAQQRWLARLSDSTIEPQPDANRSGKPVVKLFLYRNPSQPEQAFELTAFMKDEAPMQRSLADAASKPLEAVLFFQIVLAAPTLKEIERARPALLELIGNL